ncbi:uncharacterized protein B0I36DRAFT_328108 [Microdochium trichocladiopsis]|uniref:Uncharacterized protein n=1 Tax=Microdochium trichocladiopsis TaxID=1682393 RepID=A0A9P9BS23_9PEZI|nr:uncharacterized protein B0I36DRAFT_328108 [Microdochium trichocladiopsis]KAH7027880.1 hypothetical protein B0I36DRAFT_328108 [Microdochium trichocladiopsis]
MIESYTIGVSRTAPKVRSIGILRDEPNTRAEHWQNDGSSDKSQMKGPRSHELAESNISKRHLALTNFVGGRRSRSRPEHPANEHTCMHYISYDRFSGSRIFRKPIRSGTACWRVSILFVATKRHVRGSRRKSLSRSTFPTPWLQQSFRQ